MNMELIRRWNERVGEHDFVIFLGDFMYKKAERAPFFIDQLNGVITFLRGNHDHNNSLDTRIESLVVHLANKDIFCTHRPEDYSSSYSLNLIGHVHEKWRIRKIYYSILVNVGVDVWNFHPIDINEILKEVKSWKN
jgi:calcineurin-like phosphoesterase family protein